MQIAIRRWLLLSVMIGSLVLGACSTSPVASLNKTNPSNPATTTQADDSQRSNLPRLEGKATVVLKVKGAPITIEVDGANAPITAGNFVDLVQRGVYNGTMFHRVVREPQPFVVQGGDPQGKDRKIPAESLGTGSFIDPQTSQVRYIPLEIKPKDATQPLYSETFDKAGISKPPVLRHTRGAVAMARSSPPDSASAQFYFALADLSFLDGNYAVFGYVTEGMDIIDRIQIGDRIDSAEVTKGAENLKK